jgi:hypothetical protein
MTCGALMYLVPTRVLTTIWHWNPVEGPVETTFHLRRFAFLGTSIIDLEAGRVSNGMLLSFHIWRQNWPWSLFGLRSLVFFGHVFFILDELDEAQDPTLSFCLFRKILTQMIHDGSQGTSCYAEKRSRDRNSSRPPKNISKINESETSKSANIFSHFWRSGMGTAHW